MNSRIIGIAIAACGLFATSNVSAQLFRPRVIIWHPIPAPIVVGPTLPQGPQAHEVHTPGLKKLYVPPVRVQDINGHIHKKNAFITHFEVVVSPKSIERGCRPALKSEGFKDKNGNVIGTSVHPVGAGAINPTQLVDTFPTNVAGDRREWTAFQFAVNDGNGAEIDEVNVLMVTDQRVQLVDNFGRPKIDANGNPITEMANVDCYFQVNVTSGPGAGHIHDVRGGTPQPGAAAAPGPETLPAPKDGPSSDDAQPESAPEEGPKADGDRPLKLPRYTETLPKQEE